MTAATAPIVDQLQTPGFIVADRWPDLLIATDGTSAADGAVCVGAKLADRQRLEVELLTVLRDQDGLEAAVDAESRVRAQLHQFGISDDACHIEVHSGPPARTIARVAHEHRVSMVVLGMTRNGIRGLFPGAGTMSRLLPLGGTPILAVPSSGRYVPRRLMIATDFSMPSIRAARAAVEMIGDFTQVNIVNVASDERDVVSPWNRWEDGYDGGVRGAFEQLIHDLGLATHRDVATWQLKGDYASELQRFAERAGPDLISCGARELGAADRMSRRSVTAELLYRAPCALLIAPRQRSILRTPRTSGTQRSALRYESPVIPQ